MNQIFRKLVERGPILTGGAYGTELQARGLGPGESADAWNLLRADDVRSVARAYVDAGARVILANTFQANPLSLWKHGWQELAPEINTAGVELAREAARKRCLVFGSVGPIGEAGNAAEFGPAAEMFGYIEQFDSLLEAGVAGLVLETFTDLEEIVRALEDRTSPEVPMIASVVFQDGMDPAYVAALLRKAGANAIGANCMTPEEMLPVCRALRKATRLPLWMKPNAGVPRRDGERLVYDMTPEEFADGAMRLVEAGADFIGGCCGAGPAHIHALAERLVQHSAGTWPDHLPR